MSGKGGARAEDGARLARVRELFELASAIEPASRETFLGSRCEDAGVRAEVLALLRASAGAGEFLERPVAIVPETSDLAGPDVDPLVGTQVGAYRVLRLIGAGGMGAVYEAEQDAPRRKVALKVIRAWQPTAQLLRRFAMEAEALGRLQHPGIARIYEAGATRDPFGRTMPFFAMELVRGETLARLAKGPGAPGMSLSRCAEVVASVAEAVHHAHQKGVIHRDLKAANVVIEEGGAEGGVRVKVLDFGVARLADTQGTLHTDAGQVVGTLTCMSPEQVQGNSDAVDTRTDVYALGVMLYELVTGRTPFDLRGVSIAEAARRICHGAAPLPEAINPGARGDLSIIIRKAMEVEAGRRYQSAADMAADLRNYMGKRPVTARPATAWYHASRFAARNKGLVAALVAVVAMLVAGVIGTSVGLVRARASQRLAEDRERAALSSLRQAERSVDFLESMLANANPESMSRSNVTVRDALDEASARLGSELGDEPAVAFRTRTTLARTYVSVQAARQARREVEEAKRIALGTFGEDSLEYSVALATEVRVMRAEGKREDVVPLARRVLEMRRARITGDHALIAEALRGVGDACTDAGKLEDALASMEEAAGMYRRLKDPRLTGALVDCAGLLGRMHQSEQWSRAEGMLREALEAARAQGPQAMFSVASTLNTLGNNLRMQGKHEEAAGALREALALRERIYPAGHARVLDTRFALVLVLRAQEQWADTAREAGRLVEQSRVSLGGQDPRTEQALQTLALALREGGDLDGAEVAIREAVAIARHNKSDLTLAANLVDLNDVLQLEGRWAEALEVSGELVATRRAQSATHLLLATFLEEHAENLGHLARWQESLDAAREGAEILKNVKHHERYSALLLYAAAAQQQLGDTGGAEASLREAMEFAPRSVVGAARVPEIAAKLAAILRGQQREDEARAIEERAREVAAQAAKTRGDAQVPEAMPH